MLKIYQGNLNKQGMEGQECFRCLGSLRLESTYARGAGGSVGKGFANSGPRLLPRRFTNPTSFGLVCHRALRIRFFAPYRVQTPKIGKRGFRSQEKTPCLLTKGVKNPHFPCGALSRHGDFLTRNALFWGGGGFLTPETLFSRFWVFDPCEGQTDSQTEPVP